MAAWSDSRTVVGASDAGAHLDMIDTFSFSTQLLGNAVSKRRLLSVEQAVHHLTEVPAKLVGLKERGLLKAGYCADIVVFDLDKVACSDTYTRHDLPGGAGRLYADAQRHRACLRQRQGNHPPQHIHRRPARQDPALRHRHRHRRHAGRLLLTRARALPMDNTLAAMPIIDVDTHYTEHPDLWTALAPAVPESAGAARQKRCRRQAVLGGR